MIPKTQAETERIEGLMASPTPRSSFLRFLRWLLLPPLFLYLLFFLLVLVPALHFERLGLSEWGPVLQFGFDAHTNADILIFGDSSAFLGVDPRLVQDSLGLSAVVLPNTVGSLPITGELALERYLARNRPPRLLVLYFTAWDLNYQQTAQARVFFEGEEMLLQNSSRADILHFARQHPLELLAFPLRLNSTLGAHLLADILRHTDREQQTANALGHVDYSQPYPPLTRPCTLPAALLNQVGTASVQSLVDRYSTPHTRVVVYLAPIPDCLGVTTLRQRPRSPLRPEPPAILPPSSFANDGLYAHPLPAIVPATSDLFIAFLRRHLATPADPTPQVKR